MAVVDRLHLELALVAGEVHVVLAVERLAEGLGLGAAALSRSNAAVIGRLQR